MSDLLSEFFKRRSEGLRKMAEQDNAKNRTGQKKPEEKILGDKDFWDIVNTFHKRGLLAKNEKELQIILEEILEPYEDWQIVQFVERFQKLSK